MPHSTCHTAPPDTSAPTFAPSSPAVDGSGSTDSSIALEVQLDEACTVFVVALAYPSNYPNAIEVKAGTGKAGIPAGATAQIALESVPFVALATLQGLRSDTQYDLSVATWMGAAVAGVSCERAQVPRG